MLLVSASVPPLVPVGLPFASRSVTRRLAALAPSAGWLAGVTSRVLRSADATTATVTIALRSSPSTEAVMRAVPSATAVTCPAASTVATSGAEEVQMKDLPGSGCPCAIERGGADRPRLAARAEDRGVGREDDRHRARRPDVTHRDLARVEASGNGGRRGDDSGRGVEQLAAAAQFDERAERLIGAREFEHPRERGPFAERGARIDHGRGDARAREHHADAVDREAEFGRALALGEEGAESERPDHRLGRCGRFAAARHRDRRDDEEHRGDHPPPRRAGAAASDGEKGLGARGLGHAPPTYAGGMPPLICARHHRRGTERASTRRPNPAFCP
jgi:hypothetical protein